MPAACVALPATVLQLILHPSRLKLTPCLDDRAQGQPTVQTPLQNTDVGVAEPSDTDKHGPAGGNTAEEERCGPRALKRNQDGPDHNARPWCLLLDGLQPFQGFRLGSLAESDDPLIQALSSIRIVESTQDNVCKKATDGRHPLLALGGTLLGGQA